MLVDLLRLPTGQIADFEGGDGVAGWAEEADSLPIGGRGDEGTAKHAKYANALVSDVFSRVWRFSR